MEIHEKAWVVTALNLSSPWFYNDIVVWANDPSKAKALGFDKLLQENAEVCYDLAEGYPSTREVVFTDVRVNRLKAEDKVNYNGVIMTRQGVKHELWQKERDAKALKIVEETPDAICVVFNGDYNQYWGSNHSGYSSNILFAGKYTAKEAYDIVHGSSFARKEVVRLLDVELYNKNIKKEIERLGKLLL